MQTSFQDWTQTRQIKSLGTNAGALEIPFQGWRHFKEAFAPELIQRAISENPIPTTNCIDPFGGSGTTALACQFLGVHPITAEVNPFLADLIESKIDSYDTDLLTRDFGLVIKNSQRHGCSYTAPQFPRTLIEPGYKKRWIFSKEVARSIFSLLESIESLDEFRHRRLFRILLGGILVDLSNVVVSGKGRRYRPNWQSRTITGPDVYTRFIEASKNAITDIHRFSKRSCLSYSLLRGDIRQLLAGKDDTSLCVFSPPYPNSFDYTDVYNVELWTLGYLSDADSNYELRSSTLTSHVQVGRIFAPHPSGSPTLEKVMADLHLRQSMLWDRRLTQMIGAYFAELTDLLHKLFNKIKDGGSVWIVIGDSIYAGVHIETARILKELAIANGWTLLALEPFRSMQSSPQQGGRAELAETLLVLQKC
ncbi:MAG: hypothetical protein GC165_16545 [Armatimonadetes bacterium]|nr:hypothetical protein [Armatimonadota bacterium]